MPVFAGAGLDDRVNEPQHRGVQGIVEIVHVVVDAIVSDLEAARCTTITGASGVGKTRVALEVASRLDERSEAPVILWTDLSGVEADGIVGKLDRRDLCERLGATARAVRATSSSRVAIVTRTRSRRALTALTGSDAGEVA